MLLFPTLAQAAAVLLSTQVLPASAASISQRATTCNGNAEVRRAHIKKAGTRQG